MINHLRTGNGRHIFVLVHGFLGGLGYWIPLTSGLKDHFDFIAVDLPGFAASAHISTPDSISGFSASVIEVLDSLGIERFSLMGFSMGGMVAIQTALDYGNRVNKLVLYGTAASGDLPDRFESWGASIARVNSEGIEATADKTAATWFVQGNKDPFYPVCREACRGASKQGATEAMREIQRWNVRDRLREIKKPTLVIVGDKDRSTKPAESIALWQSIPGAQLCILPNAAHGLHMEKSGLFNRIVLDFVLGA